MATQQDITISADGKIQVGKSKPVQMKTDAQIDRAMQKAVQCDVGRARPIPVRKVG